MCELSTRVKDKKKEGEYKIEGRSTSVPRGPCSRWAQREERRRIQGGHFRKAGESFLLF